MFTITSERDFYDTVELINSLERLSLIRYEYRYEVIPLINDLHPKLHEVYPNFDLSTESIGATIGETLLAILKWLGNMFMKLVNFITGKKKTIDEKVNDVVEKGSLKFKVGTANYTHPDLVDNNNKIISEFVKKSNYITIGYLNGRLKTLSRIISGFTVSWTAIDTTPTNELETSFKNTITNKVDDRLLIDDGFELTPNPKDKTHKILKVLKSKGTNNHKKANNATPTTCKEFLERCEKIEKLFKDTTAVYKDNIVKTDKFLKEWEKWRKEAEAEISSGKNKAGVVLSDADIKKAKNRVLAYARVKDVISSITLANLNIYEEAIDSAKRHIELTKHLSFQKK